MRIIISPAKKMRVVDDWMEPMGAPVCIEEAQRLWDILRGLNERELGRLFKANSAITHENFLRLQECENVGGATPALLSYVGIQYQYMAPQVFSKAQWEYVCAHLRILSGLYGILRPADGIAPYRLEMQTKLAADGATDLYAFWGDRIYRELTDGDGEILNLASKEYGRAVERFLEPGVRFVTCVFAERGDGGRLKVKATEAKMARGEMVRYLAETGGECAAAARGFDRLGFSFAPELSDDASYVFIKEKGK